MNKLFNHQSIKQQVSFKQIESRGYRLSQEQDQYKKHDFWTNKEDTVLVACAGSGKTRCMVEKIHYLTTVTGKLSKNEIMVFSYSKLTIEHAKQCCKQLNSDKTTFYNSKLIKTIDSFCYDIMQKLDLQCAIQVLSAKLNVMMAEQQDNPQSQLVKCLQSSSYKKIKAIFIDEAQDLNEVQYNIVLGLQKILGATLHFIGDPNQNIYQFRGSFEKYFLNHPGSKFHLSKNFRCGQYIDAFSQFFKYYQFKNDNVMDDTIDNKTKQTKVQMVVDLKGKNRDFIVTEIRKLLKSGYKANHIAVLSPVLGREFNDDLLEVANYLESNRIPVVKYYNELREDSQRVNIVGKSRKIGVNLLTVHGSKGLEFGVVFLIKFQDKMLSGEQFDAQYLASQSMNLLYVAITRAKQQLYILHDNGNERKHMCSIIVDIPHDIMHIQGNIDEQMEIINRKIQRKRQLVDEFIEFPTNVQDNQRDILLITRSAVPQYFEINNNELKFTTSQYKWRSSVTQFIQKLSQQDMLSILDLMTHKKKCETVFTITEDQQKLLNTIRKEQEALVGCLFEYIFYYQLQQQKNKTINIHKVIFVLKDTIYTQSGLIKLNEHCLISNPNQLYQLRELLQQAKQGNIPAKSLSDSIRSLHNISDHEIEVIDQDIQQRRAEFLDFGQIGIRQLSLITDNVHCIFNAINDINEHKNWEKSLNSIIYIILLKFAANTKYQKYIQYDIQKIKELAQLLPIFQNMEELAHTMSIYNIHYQFEVSNDDMIGYIDFLVSDETENAIIDMKVQDELCIENILQLVLYEMLLEYQAQISTDSRLIIINCIKGVKYEILLDKRDQLIEHLGKLLQDDFIKRIGK